jgi:hypothetical protein
MAGGKGGSTTSSVQIPEYIEKAAQRNLNKAERISQLGYVPYYGPDVAAFTPMQQAAFQNTADTASAFGMAAPTSQQDIMGGMSAPTQYAGGVQGYSSAPLYQQSVDELARQRPAQKSYIDSFFIDPYTGQYASQPIDYNQYGTMANERAAQRANDLAIAQAQAGPSTINYDFTSFAANPNLSVQPNDQIFNIAPPEVQIAQQIVATDPTNPNYNDAFQTVYDYQSQQAASDPYGQSTGFGVTTDVLDATGGANAWLPPTVSGSSQASSAITAPASGITDTSTAGTGTQILNDVTELGTNLAANTLLGNLLLGDTYETGGVNNPIETPTVSEMAAAAPSGMTYNPSTGGYERTGSSSSAPATVGADAGDGMVWAKSENSNALVRVAAPKETTSTQTASSAPSSSPKPVARPSDSGGDSDSGGGGKSIVCTEMYRQTQLDDWGYAMKTWYIYQKKHLTPYHEIGYHTMFKPFVGGMRRSEIITKIGAYAARERTKHLRYILTKGKAKDSLFGRVLCNVMEPTLYVVGRIASVFRKDA